MVSHTNCTVSRCQTAWYRFVLWPLLETNRCLIVVTRCNRYWSVLFHTLYVNNVCWQAEGSCISSLFLQLSVANTSKLTFHLEAVYTVYVAKCLSHRLSHRIIVTVLDYFILISSWRGLWMETAIGSMKSVVSKGWHCLFGVKPQALVTKQLLWNVFKTFQNGWILFEMLSFLLVVFRFFLMEFQLVSIYENQQLKTNINEMFENGCK